MKLFKTLAVHMRQMLSWPFITVSLGICATYLMSGLGYALQASPDAISAAVFATFGGTTYYTIYILPSFAYSMTFAREWQERASMYWIIRSGITNYAISKVFVSALAGFLSHFLGLSLFIGGICIKLPLYAETTTSSIYVTGLMEQGHVFSGAVCYIMDVSSAAALAAALGMSISFLFPNSYVALAAPLGLMLLISRITDYLSVLPLFNPGNWASSIDTAGSPEMALSYKLCLVIIMLSIYSLIAVKELKRRVVNA